MNAPTIVSFFVTLGFISVLKWEDNGRVTTANHTHCCIHIKKKFMWQPWVPPQSFWFPDFYVVLSVLRGTLAKKSSHYDKTKLKSSPKHRKEKDNNDSKDMLRDKLETNVLLDWITHQHFFRFIQYVCKCQQLKEWTSEGSWSRHLTVAHIVASEKEKTADIMDYFLPLPPK